MKFCPKCGAILVPKKGTKVVKMVCHSCGFTSMKKENVVLKETVKKSEKPAIAVVDKRAETLPRIKEVCPKCNFSEAFYWTVQTRAGDEAETRFFKCVKCNHTWRAY